MAEELLFDELLSPSEENGSGFVLDGASLSPQVSLDQEPGPGTDHLSVPDSKSMENILLENCGMDESIDLGHTGNIEEQEQSGNDLSSNNGSTSGIAASVDDNVTSQVIITSQVSDNEQSQTETQHPEAGSEQHDSQDKAPGDISKYFEQKENNEDIFDSLLASTLEKCSLEEPLDTDNVQSKEETEDVESTVPTADQQKPSDNRRVRIHLESHSSVNEEPTTVDFQEDKGVEPLKPTPSTRSLTKYFTSDGATVEDDAKRFFDTFTADEQEESAVSSPRGVALSASEPMVTSSSDPSMMLPPETPPIPSGSPIPSPFHQMSAPPSATESLPFFPDVITDTKEGQRSRATSLSQADIINNQAQFSVGDVDDPFTVSLNISDIDRRHDAWIPSEVTRQVLMAILTGQTTSIVTPPEQLTRPGVIKDDPLGDPVRDLVQRFLGEQEAQKRVCLTVDSVPQDEMGLRQLIKAECWRSAVDLTGRLLTQCGQGLGKVNTPSKHTPYTLQLWFCRLSLMIRLHMFTAADSECQAFGNMDKPDLFYEFYQDKYPGRRGSMVPFGLRVLHAELPLHLGKTQESLDRLYYIHAIVSKILSHLESGLAEDGSMLSLSIESRKASRELWERRSVQLLYSIVNCLLAVKDYAASLRVLEDLIIKDAANKDKLLCSIARIYLQIGDTSTAPIYFSKAEKLIPNAANSCQSHMNKGFLSLGLNHFTEAYDSFEAAVTADPSNAVAVNNMAVCALYTGQLTSALSSLENLVHKDPDLYLQEGILFNLCTLYELESSHAIYRKQQLLTMVSKHKGNGFNVACLKIV